MDQKKYSLVIGGVIVSVLGTVLVTAFGFTDSCSSEIISKIMPWIPAVIGGGMSYIGRIRIGDVTPLGFKKDRYR